jgi:hypothetical protein
MSFLDSNTAKRWPDEEDYSSHSSVDCPGCEGEQGHSDIDSKFD